MWLTDAAHAGTHMTVYARPGMSGGEELAGGGEERFADDRALAGREARTELTVLDLPDPDDMPWESGPLLAIPVRDGASGSD